MSPKYVIQINLDFFFNNTIILDEIQSKLQGALDSERLFREECILIRTKRSSLETQLSAIEHECEMLKVQLEQQKTEALISDQTHNS